MAAECFPVGEFIADELEARGWTPRELAERMLMVGEPLDLIHCEVEVVIANDSHQAYIERRFADGLERAFGIEADMWLRLDATYRAWKRAIVERVN